MIHTKLGGEYKISAYKMVDGKRVNERVLSDWFPNLITNLGLNYIAENDGWVPYCHVGSSSNAPAVTDISLVTPVAVSPSISAQMSGAATVNGSSPYESYKIYTYTFGIGVAAGNLSEVGVGWGTGLGSLFSRALILDTGGSPTTITVLSDEYLEVKYKLTYYPIITDTTGTVTFTGGIGGTYDFILRTASVLSLVRPFSTTYMLNIAMGRSSSLEYDWETYYGDIGAITSKPANAIAISGGFDSFTNAAYVTDSFELYLTLVLGLTKGNHVSGLRSIFFPWGINYHQCQFDPAIPKTSDDIVTLTFKKTWGRV